MFAPNRLSGGVIAKGTSCIPLPDSGSIQDWIMMSSAAWFFTRMDASLAGAWITTRVPPKVMPALAMPENNMKAPAQSNLEDNASFMV
ncbi:hypothetical protein CSB93_5710 [Pseudomonas paraeruginosa]|uniref:Uncharacterized protein n=1 Tax=Pseudomonas paraeruginosa TaxID=2994495 RepID=A0A2R3IW16_9PSED|nr:hypothetical protein CSB93_5710 [Pseudomonas paraeruginosa]